MMRRQDQYSKIFYELSALVLNILRLPNDFSDGSPVINHMRSTSSMYLLSTSAAATMQQMSPAGFASLMLGMSLALMLCGSVTFFIGFMLMPWVIGLLVVLYFVGIMSSLSMLGRTILCPTASPPSPTKEATSWKFM